MPSALRRIQELEASGFIDRLPDGVDRRPRAGGRKEGGGAAGRVDAPWRPVAAWA